MPNVILGANGLVRMIEITNYPKYKITKIYPANLYELMENTNNRFLKSWDSTVYVNQLLKMIWILSFNNSLINGCILRAKVLVIISH